MYIKITDAFRALILGIGTVLGMTQHVLQLARSMELHPYIYTYEHAHMKHQTHVRIFLARTDITLLCMYNVGHCLNIISRQETATNEHPW